MKRSKELKQYIQKYDEPILSHLINIKMKKGANYNYKLIFEFSPNEYFTNTKLIKSIILSEDDESICKESNGTEIMWKEGKNVTVELIKKYIKNRSKD